MNEQDFFKKLEEINKSVISVREALRPKLWKSFLDGVLRGMGSIVGVVLALVLIGWILNVVGVIPAFRDQVNSWKELIDRATSQQNLPNVKSR